jgi:hypothetical protein
MWVQLEDWAVGLYPGQRVLLVARSWETTVEFFTTVQRCTVAGHIVVTWPETLDVEVVESSWAESPRVAPMKRAA